MNEPTRLSLDLMSRSREVALFRVFRILLEDHAFDHSKRGEETLNTIFFDLFTKLNFLST